MTACAVICCGEQNSACFHLTYQQSLANVDDDESVFHEAQKSSSSKQSGKLTMALFIEEQIRLHVVCRRESDEGERKGDSNVRMFIFTRNVLCYVLGVPMCGLHAEVQDAKAGIRAYRHL